VSSPGGRAGGLCGHLGAECAAACVLLDVGCTFGSADFTADLTEDLWQRNGPGCIAEGINIPVVTVEPSAQRACASTVLTSSWER
jgi:hypothetical protein